MLRTTAPATIWNWWLSVTAAFQTQALADKYGNASVWDDPQAMLLAVKPDVVSVCSPNRFHYEHTLMALEAGCHVMCEKPPAMTPEQAREMCDTARKLGKVLAYDFHHRFALDTQQLREQVTNGVLGEIYVTTARALRRCGVPGWGVFTNKELQGGGPLIDIGIHMLDAAMYVLGFPAVKSVNAHSFQKIGTQRAAVNLASGIRQLTASKIRYLAPLNFITAAFCGWKRHLHSTSANSRL